MGHDENGFFEEPPADPEEWTDEQWIAWLTATDEQDDEGTDEPQRVPQGAMGRIVGSSGGQVLGSAMLGMAHALFGVEKDQIVQVAPGRAEPEPDEPFTVHLDPEHPERSTVVFRADPDADLDA